MLLHNATNNNTTTTTNNNNNTTTIGTVKPRGKQVSAANFFGSGGGAVSTLAWKCAFAFATSSHHRHISYHPSLSDIHPP
jgi:hypothetical protein